ncbi:MAG: hypothetical protein WBV43_12320 [Pseudolabrys sp.]
MIESKKDRQRIIELILEGRAAGDTVEIVVRRIFEQMPHLTGADIAELTAVCAEESRMDAAEHEARADAYSRIKDIIRETEETSGNAGLTVNRTLALLKNRAQAGDARATELSDELTKAITFVGGL